MENASHLTTEDFRRTIVLHPFLAWLNDPAQHRPLTPTTIREYERQITAFARWLTEELGVSWEAEAISARRMASYLQGIVRLKSTSAARPDHGIMVP